MILENERLSASAVGILHCLQKLAEEAATLNLPRTVLAIQQAVSAAVGEAVPFGPGTIRH